MVDHPILLDDRDSPRAIGDVRVWLELQGLTGQEAVQVVVGVIFLLPARGVLVVDLLAVGGEQLVVDKKLIAQQALITALTRVVNLVLGPVLCKGEDFVTVMAGILLLPGVGVEVTPQASQAHIGTLADDAHIKGLPIHDQLVVVVLFNLRLLLARSPPG